MSSSFLAFAGFLRASVRFPLFCAYPLGFRCEESYSGVYGRSAGNLRLDRLALPDVSGMAEHFARFPRSCHRCGPLPYFNCSGLLTPYPDLEVTRNLFESRSDPAGAILLGRSTNQAATHHHPVHCSLRASLVQCGASPSLLRCQFGIDRRLAEFTRRYADAEPRRERDSPILQGLTMVRRHESDISGPPPPSHVQALR